MSKLDQQNWEDVAEIAAILDVVPIQSSSFDLFIDLDNQCILNYGILDVLLEKKIVVPDCMLVTTSKNGNHHVYLRLVNSLDIASRVALQAALGSDLMREALAIVRKKLGTEQSAISVLFETSDEAVRVKEWLEDMEVETATRRLRKSTPE